MLDINHVSKTFNPGTINEKRALIGLDLHLKEGDFVTVIGGNGAGKSTMLENLSLADNKGKPFNLSFGVNKKRMRHLINVLQD